MDIKELLKAIKEIKLTPEQIEDHWKRVREREEEFVKQAKQSSSTEFLNRTYSL